MAKFRELTYRFEFLDPRIVRDMATRLVGQRVVIRMPDSEVWKRAWLISVSKSGDRFRVRWTRNHSRYTTLVGIWRVHNPILFSQKGLLPVPVEPAKVRSNHKPIPGGKMATRSRSTSSKKSSTKSSGSKKAASGNNGGGRRDKLGHMTEAQRKKAANTIYKMRGQGKSWTEIMEVVDIPGSMTGRRLLRDYGPDDAESVIRERKLGSNSKKSDKAKTKSKRRAAAPDDDEDDDEEETKPRRRRRVKVKTGRGSKSNPSS